MTKCLKVPGPSKSRHSTKFPELPPNIKPIPFPSVIVEEYEEYLAGVLTKRPERVRFCNN